MGKGVASRSIELETGLYAGTVIRGVIPKPRVLSSGARDLARTSSEPGLVDVSPSLRQIVPVRIHRLNEFNLLAPPPALNLLFAIDRNIRIEKALEVNQPSQVIPAGKAVNDFVLMLPDASRQVSCDSGVQDMRALTICHDVDVKLFGWSHRPLFTENSRYKSVTDVHRLRARSLAPLEKTRGFGMTPRSGVQN
jgi:hypothetical protein